MKLNQLCDVFKNDSVNAKYRLMCEAKSVIDVIEKDIIKAIGQKNIYIEKDRPPVGIFVYNSSTKKTVDDWLDGTDNRESFGKWELIGSPNEWFLPLI